ncbi:MAG TPA: HEPN domain-containing protein [Methanothrix sp.]|nr:HEPN domain-containing protein [Methanothrix sp.]
MAEELLKIEKDNYKNPPRINEQKAVQGLRGGAAVLMVAAWENFLKQLVEEELTSLTTLPPKVPFENLPPKMQQHSVFQTLERATKGPRFQPKNRINRLPDIEQACKVVISGTINPVAFSDIGSNPNPEVVKEMFRNMGISDIFENIKDDFEKKWKNNVPTTFINDKLLEIINRRHVVAHKADALKISRSDLNESVRFMKIIAPLLEKQLRFHINKIIRDRRE